MNQSLRFLVCGALFGLAALAASQTAFAQPGGGGRGRGPGGFGGGPGGRMQISNMQLVTAEPVQKELKLSDEQIESIEKIREESRGGQNFRDLFSGLQDLSEEERTKKMAEIQEKMADQRKAIDKKVEEVLKDEQKTRLKEISIQVRGVSALFDKDLQDELKITDEQKAKLTDVRDELNKARQELMQSEDREAAREKMQELQTKSREETLAVLTDDQKQQYEKMQGEKIEIDRRSLFGGRGGFGGPGGGGPGGGGQGGGRRQRGGNNNDN